MTESLFDLGFGDSLIGITDYCIFPEDKVINIPRVGGTKNPDLAKIISLQPDLVIINQEENSKHIVDCLEEAGFNIWISFPKTARQVVGMLWDLVNLFQSSSAAARVKTLELTLDWAESASNQRERWTYFCPIWKSDENGESPSWWMTFNQDTYTSDVLRIFGGTNVFAERVRRYPLEADLGKRIPEEPGLRDIRYPHVTLDETIQAMPQIILLPNEPYKFTKIDQQQAYLIFESCPAAINKKILLVDGSLLTWCGTRLARALNHLPALLE